jgi:hypothetical protein
MISFKRNQTGLPIPDEEILELRAFERLGMSEEDAKAFHSDVYNRAAGEKRADAGIAREEAYYELSHDTTIRERLEAWDWINSKDYGVIPFSLWENQLELLERIHQCQEEDTPCEILVLKARQRGCSTLIQLIIKDLLCLNPFWKALTISHEQKSTRNIARIPSFSWQRQLYRPRAEFHITQPSAFSNGSLYEIETAQADAPGRSYTYNIIHLSEAAHYPNDQVVISGVMDCLPESGFYLVIQETTAKGQANQFYEVWKGAEQGDNDYIPVFHAWFHDPRYQRRVDEYQAEEILATMDEDERDGRDIWEWTPEQMAWRRHRINTRYGGDKELFHQEMPSTPQEAFLVSGRPVFDRGAMLAARKKVGTIRPAFQGDLIERVQR